MWDVLCDIWLCGTGSGFGCVGELGCVRVCFVVWGQVWLCVRGFGCVGLTGWVNW